VFLVILFLMRSAWLSKLAGTSAANSHQETVSMLNMTFKQPSLQFRMAMWLQLKRMQSVTCWHASVRCTGNKTQAAWRQNQR